MNRFLKIVLFLTFCAITAQQQGCSITNNQDINLPDLAVRSGQM